MPSKVQQAPTSPGTVNRLTPANLKRARRGNASIIAHRIATDTGALQVHPKYKPLTFKRVIEEELIDLLADLRHYCDARKWDFGALDRKAYQHYLDEARPIIWGPDVAPDDPPCRKCHRSDCRCVANALKEMRAAK